jgi:hypothetical protein
MIRPAEGDLLHSPTARPCMRRAFLATSRARIATFVFTRSHDHPAWKGRGAATSRRLRLAH